jgi:hypothetical protein
MDESRPARQRLLAHVAGASPYDRTVNIYIPTDRAGSVAVQPSVTVDERLFAHDLHVTAYVCNAALGLLKRRTGGTP